MNDDTLNFLYCFDSNYHNQAFTSIHSLLENVSKKINIFVIHNREFSVTELPDSIANHNNLKNFKSYKFVDKEHTFPNLENAHLSEATYYRLFIENYLPSDIQKLIYLWMLKYSSFKKKVWETSTLSTRIISWLLNIDVIINNGTFEFKKKFFQNIIAQCNHLKKI